MTAWTTFKCMLGCSVTLHVYIGVMRQCWTFVIFCASFGGQGESTADIIQQSLTYKWGWRKTLHIGWSCRRWDGGFMFSVPSPRLCCTVIHFWLWTLFTKLFLSAINKWIKRNLYFAMQLGGLLFLCIYFVLVPLRGNKGLCFRAFASLCPPIKGSIWLSVHQKRKFISSWSLKHEIQCSPIKISHQTLA